MGNCKVLAEKDSLAVVQLSQSTAGDFFRIKTGS